MRRAGKSRLPEDRQMSLDPLSGGGVVCLRNGDQPWEDASRRVLSLRRTAEGMLRAGTLPATPGAAPAEAPNNGVRRRAPEGMAYRFRCH